MNAMKSRRDDAAVIPFPHATAPSHLPTLWQTLAAKVAADLPPEPSPDTAPDAALQMLEARYAAIIDFINGNPKAWPDLVTLSTSGEEAVTDILCDIETDCYHRINSIAAMSVAGVLVKARLAQRELEIDGSVPDWTGEAVDSLIADLERIGGTA